jgi:hypothetical protein
MSWARLSVYVTGASASTASACIPPQQYVSEWSSLMAAGGTRLGGWTPSQPRHLPCERRARRRGVCVRLLFSGARYRKLWCEA